MMTFSIITPTYNRSNELIRLYNSIFIQTYKSFEWVIVDDGSIDETREIINSFKGVCIKYFYQLNKGVNSARNFGKEKSSGRYNIYLDSDDEFYDENTLKRIAKDIDDIKLKDFGMITYDSIAHNLNQIHNYSIELDTLNKWLCNKIEERIVVVNSLKDNMWPVYNGYEGIKHFKLLESNICFYVNRPERIYHQGALNQLTSPISFIKNVEDGFNALCEIWERYGCVILKECKFYVGKLHYQILFRALFLSDRTRFFNILFANFFYLNLKGKIIALLFIFFIFIPFSLRIKIFLKLKNY